MIKKGKIFGKLHIVDLLALLVIILVIVANVSDFSPDKLTSYSHGKEVKIRYEVITYEYNPTVFERLVPGTVLAEDKKYLDAEIKDIEILDKSVSYIDNNGDTVVDAHPLYKKARMVIEATVIYEDEAYKLGKQEIREAKPHFIVTEWSNVSAIITEVEELD